MTVMPANNTYWLVSYWQGLYGGLGHLYGPDRFTQPTPAKTIQRFDGASDSPRGRVMGHLKW